MKKGGYKIIDFKGTALSGTAVEMPGIYDQIVDDYDKPIMVSGVILSGELQDDAYASVKVNDDSVSLTVYGGVITVTDDDEVSFAAAKTPAELAAEIGDLDDLETTEKENVVGAINEVKGDKIDKTWVLIGSIANKVRVTIPDTATEILVHVSQADDENHVKIIPLQIMGTSPSIMQIDSTYYNNSTHVFINANISKTSFQIRNFEVNGTAISDYDGSLFYR